MSLKKLVLFSLLPFIGFGLLLCLPIIGCIYVFFLFYNFNPDQSSFSPGTFAIPSTIRECPASSDIPLKVFECGDSKSEKVIVFLHGFPENGLLTFGRYLEHFAKKGFYVLAPNMRGYPGSLKSLKWQEFHPYLLANDISNLIKQKTVNKKAVIVGHDWGAGVAWMTGYFHPDVVEGLVALCVPELREFESSLLSSTQIFRSWYMIFFNLPGALSKLKSKNFSWLFHYFINSAAPGTFSKGEKIELSRTWKESLDSMIQYYKMALQISLRSIIPFNGFHHLIGNRKLYMPVLMIAASNDRFLTTGPCKSSQKWCTLFEYKEYNCSHWIPHEKFQNFAEDLDLFLARIYQN